MPVTLDRIEEPLVEGRLIERVNRFVLSVEIDGQVHEAYLPETGRLTTVLVDDATVICLPVSDPERRTDYTALAVHNGTVYVTVEAVRANALLATAVERELVPALSGWSLARREPGLPDGGRADLLCHRDGFERYVEVKAVTHAEDGIGKFPDAPTKRGRRHLQTLGEMTDGNTAASVVFVAMRPDAEVIRPYREIDPAFAEELATAQEAGVDLHAIGTEFAPPAWRLVEPTLPVELA